MRSLTLCFIVLVSVLRVTGQDTTAVINRVAYKVKLVIDKKTNYESDIKATPWFVQGNNLQLYPGEELFLEAEVDNGNIKSVKVVKENMHPSTTISISFTQVVEKKQHEMMMLKIANPFNKELSYKTKILPFKSNAWAPAITLPVRAGTSSFETWPEIITSIVLSEWSLK